MDSKKTKLNFALALFLCVISNPLVAESKFSTHGYLRSGGGQNDRGGSQSCFQAPGASAKYRLGNECDHFGEVRLIHQQPLNDNAEPTLFKTFITGEWFIPTHNNSNSQGDIRIKFPEMFVEVSNVEPVNNLLFWAGTRHYRRHDVHMLDFYFSGISGSGGGIDHIPLPLGEFAYAFFRETVASTVETTDRGKLGQTTHDIRWHSIPLGKQGGELTLMASIADTRGGKGTSGTTYFPGRGFAATVMHTYEWGNDQYNKIALQYGTGLSVDFNLLTSINSVTTETLARARNANQHWRLTEHMVVQATENINMMAVFVWDEKDNGQSNTPITRWTSLGARPIYSFSDAINIALEAGMDWVNQQSTGRKGSLFKITLAPELSLGRNVFARPTVRAFATYAKWSDGIIGGVSDRAYLGAKHGASFGVQLETWW